MYSVKNKMLVVSGCWLLVAAVSSCSTDPKKKTDETNSETTISIDSTTHGLVGVIEKNPPVQQGDYTVKYPNGIVKMRGYYVNGKRNGQWTSFFENGKIQSEGFFKDGLRDGKAVVYYETGQVYYTGYYNEGREAGVWIFYSQDGKEIQRKNYESQ